MQKQKERIWLRKENQQLKMENDTLKQTALINQKYHPSVQYTETTLEKSSKKVLIIQPEITRRCGRPMGVAAGGKDSKEGEGVVV